MSSERTIFFCPNCKFSREENKHYALEMFQCPGCGYAVYNFREDRDGHLSLRLVPFEATVHFYDYARAKVVLEKFLELFKVEGLHDLFKVEGVGGLRERSSTPSGRAEPQRRPDQLVVGAKKAAHPTGRQPPKARKGGR